MANRNGAKSFVLFPIQSEKSPDSGFFTCDPTNKCIMPSSRERHKGLIGRGHDLRLLRPCWWTIAGRFPRLGTKFLFFMQIPLKICIVCRTTLPPYHVISTQWKCPPITVKFSLDRPQDDCKHDILAYYRPSEVLFIDLCLIIPVFTNLRA